MHPDEPMQLDLCANPDFAGAGAEQDDPDNARSRAGCAAMLQKKQFVLGSRVQNEITLFAAEAECAALSQGMRALILAKRIAKHACLKKCAVSKISEAHENNQAAWHVAAANPPQLAARIEHWNIKHHWFNSHSGQETQLLPIPAQDQLTNVFAIHQGTKRT